MKKSLLWLLPGILVITVVVAAYFILHNETASNKEQPMVMPTIEHQFQNADNQGQLKVPIGVIYSNPFKSKSVFVEIEHNRMTSHELEAAGIWKLQHTSQGQNEIWMWSDRNKNLYRFNYKQIKVTAMEELEHPPITLEDNQGLLVKGINVNIEKNLIEYQLKGKRHTLEFPPLVTQVIHDGKNLYMFSDVVDQERSCLYVVDIESGKTIQTIPLQEKFASDIAFYQENVVVSTENRLTVFHKTNGNVQYIDLPEKNMKPDQFHVHNGFLYLTYANDITHEAGFLKFSSNFAIEANQRLAFPYKEAVFYGDDLYILGKLPSKDSETFNGLIGEFSLKTGKKSAQRILPFHRMKVQDLIIMLPQGGTS